MKQAKVYASHGIHGGGKKELERFATAYTERGHDYELVEYPWVSFIRANRAATQVARDLAKRVIAPSIGIGYSNGCMALCYATDRGANFQHLILVAPALRNNFKFAPQIKRVDIIAAPDDWALVAGKTWRVTRDALTLGLLRTNDWGNLGRVGYKGRDPRIHMHWTEGGHGGALKEALMWGTRLEEISRTLIPRPTAC